VRLLLVHLRLPFQLLLAPIFMLGALLGGALPTFQLLVAFLAVHAGIYGGMTAFNSYYDRDRGPIGMLKHPRPAGRFVRDASVILQIAAVVALVIVRPMSAIPAALLVGMGVAYSHPRWRWKRSLGASLAAVGVGQGLLAFAIGYLAAGAPAATLLDPRSLAAAAGSALITLGLYPVTQVYQVEEDSARGDRSLAVAIGWRPALVASALTLAAGVALVALAMARRIASYWLVFLGAGVLLFWLLLYAWSRRFESLDAYRNHDWALGLGALASSAFWVLILSEWIRAIR
jgi:1,4-dihydroxy-2-naphthoate octaprenyltransferase